MQQAEKSTTVYSKRVMLRWLPYALFTTSILVTLIAIFALSEWVEVSGWHHASQHVMIFSSGLVAGGSLLSIYKTNKEKKNES
jgi:uncharacterized oligopeptide transporter (OPT) family protein